MCKISNYLHLTKIYIYVRINIEYAVHICKPFTADLWMINSKTFCINNTHFIALSYGIK